MQRAVQRPILRAIGLLCVVSTGCGTERPPPPPPAVVQPVPPPLPPGPPPDTEKIREALIRSESWVVLDTPEGGQEQGRSPRESPFGETPATDLRQGAARRMVADEVKSWPADHRRGFLADLAPAALENALLHEVPPSVTMAQAALESGWGRSGLAQQHKNLFGVKAGSSAAAVALPTRETVDGTSRTQRERFRTYDSWSESLAHHGALLSEDDRYAHARDDWHDWRSFLTLVAPVYATDPRYARLVGSIVVRYGLDRWDDLVVEAAASGPVEPGELGEDGSRQGI